MLLDPYGRAVAVPQGYSRDRAREPGDNATTAMKSVVVAAADYDWEGDQPPRRPFSATVIYELHVAGFTRHPSSGVTPDRRGTYAGLIDRIPYLVDLGITAVELLPVFQFDPQEAPPGLSNFWGYVPVSFFAPHHGYSSRPGPLAARDEFRDMVKALHRADIEVLLDVVYNHTAEGNDERSDVSVCKGPRELRPTTSLERDPSDGHDRSRYANFSGCGNTLNGNGTAHRSAG